MRGELALAEEGYRQAIALSRTRVHTAALNNLGVLLKKDQRCEHHPKNES